jgi:hypothetical protein
MPELDGLKEDLAYLRLWLGMLAVSEISLLGWTASAVDTAPARLLSLAIVVIMVLGIGVFLLHRQIGFRIREIRSL